MCAMWNRHTWGMAICVVLNRRNTVRLGQRPAIDAIVGALKPI